MQELTIRNETATSLSENARGQRCSVDLALSEIVIIPEVVRLEMKKKWGGTYVLIEEYSSPRVSWVHPAS